MSYTYPTSYEPTNQKTAFPTRHEITNDVLYILGDVTPTQTRHWSISDLGVAKLMT